MADILIVEDELSINELIRRNLTLTGHRCTQVYDGDKAIELLAEKQFDLVILDIMLPGADGYQVFDEARGIPVIFLTAKSELSDKLRGLTKGADDYITKPFVPLEAVARVHSNLRRFYDLGGGGRRQAKDDVLKTKSLRLDLKRCLLYRGEEKIELTSVEFKIMKLFMEHPGKVFTKQQLFEEGWGESYLLSDNNVMVCISKLRAKLDHGDTEYIRTIRGLGYRLEDEDN